MHTMEGQFRADLAIATNPVQYDLNCNVNRTQMNLARAREYHPDDRFTPLGLGTNPTRSTALEHNPTLLYRKCTRRINLKKQQWEVVWED